MQIKFCGAAKTVTGSSHLLILNDGFKILLDCGMFQGKDVLSGQVNVNETFLFNPGEINCMILSHAHIDHSGRIPKFVHDGFKGKIYCTSATADLCKIMLLDSAHIQENDAKFISKKNRQKGLPEEEALYTADDVMDALKLFTTVNYEQLFSIRNDVSFLLRDNGHLIGSGSVNLTIKEGNNTIALGFTGDIGRPNRPILKDPIAMPSCDYLITESTYGGRLHEAFPDDKEHLLNVIKDTCEVKKGKVIIPAFSVGRTQEIVYMLDQLNKEGKLSHIPVYVDSPLSTNATEVYKRHPECFDEELHKYIMTDPNPFGFNDLTYITEVDESKKLNDLATPCIIISASGMAEAGRIVHHIFNHVEDPNCTILIVGYCAESTLGAHLRDGAKKIHIFGELLQVKAHIEVMDSFSAHGDQKEMLQFLDPLDRGKLKQIFIVHGDNENQAAFKDALEKNRFKNISIPARGDVVEIH
jgi:metallo-beta-lactamase family protein